MIAPLRRRHLGMIIVIGIVVMPVFIASVINRADIPVLYSESHPPLAQKSLLFSHRQTKGLQFNLMLYKTEHKEVTKVIIRLLEPTGIPDLLVYWTPDTLANGILVGQLSATEKSDLTRRLPSILFNASGKFIFWSNAWQTEVLTVPVSQLKRSGQ